MRKAPEIEWHYRETQDSEYAYGRAECFDITIQDCDGDFSRWEIRRGKQYMAMGEIGFTRNSPYHFDAAKDKAVEVVTFLLEAVDMNDFVAKQQCDRMVD